MQARRHGPWIRTGLDAVGVGLFGGALLLRGR